MLYMFTREFNLYNWYKDGPDGEEKHQTVETISHAVRILHKLSQVHTVLLVNINLANEHSNLPMYVGALSSVKELRFGTISPTKMAQLARFFIAFRTLSTLISEVPILIEPRPLPLPPPRYASKSSRFCKLNLEQTFCSIGLRGPIRLRWFYRV